MAPNDTPEVIAAVVSETHNLLEQLQRAAEQHQKIIERTSDLIQRLREEIKDVSREPRPDI